MTAVEHLTIHTMTQLVREGKREGETGEEREREEKTQRERKRERKRERGGGGGNVSM